MQYTLHDLVVLPVTGLLFSLFFYVPGYTLAWLSDLFAFRQRMFIMRSAIAVLLSFSISPLIAFWLVRYSSFGLAFVVFDVSWIGFVVILWREKAWGGIGIFFRRLRTDRLLLIGVALLLAWEAIALLSISDLQLGDRLYFSQVNLDHTQRVPITAAIFRDGLPPPVPTFYPGHTVRISLFNFADYFTELMGSMVEEMVSGAITAREATIGLVLWSGIGMASILALYFRLRRPDSARVLKLRTVIAFGLLAVAGPDTIAFLLKGSWFGQVTSWPDIFLSVPHHVAGIACCFFAYLIVEEILSNPRTRSALLGVIFAGAALASSVGLSLLTPVIFVLFWPIWTLTEAVRRRSLATFLIPTLAGIVAVIFTIPLLADFTQGLQTHTGFHLVFDVWSLIDTGGTLSGNATVQLTSAIVLPIFYVAEMGFFFVIGIYYVIRMPKAQRHIPEFYLLVLGFLIASFIRDPGVAINNIGRRALMPAQFVLLIWSTDVLLHMFGNRLNESEWNDPFVHTMGTYWRAALNILLVWGFLSSAYIVLSYRMAYIWGDDSTGLFGQMMYDLHQVYDYVRTQTSLDTVIQYDPNGGQLDVDFASGLYGNRQVVLGTPLDQSLYSVPPQTAQEMMKNLTFFFVPENGTQDDRKSVCQQYDLALIIVKATDPVWQDSNSWIYRTKPLYQAPLAMVFRCGDG